MNVNWADDVAGGVIRNQKWIFYHGFSAENQRRERGVCEGGEISISNKLDRLLSTNKVYENVVTHHYWFQYNRPCLYYNTPIPTHTIHPASLSLGYLSMLQVRLIHIEIDIGSSGASGAITFVSHLKITQLNLRWTHNNRVDNNY